MKKNNECKRKSSLKQTKLQSNQNNNREDNLEKIRGLVEKTTAMQMIAEERHKTADQYFEQLRKKLDTSGTFLKNAKQDIENIKFLFQRDHIDNIEARYSLDDISKTDEEIEEEMKCVQQKLNNLQTRLNNLKTKTKTEAQTFEDAISKTIMNLDNASKGIYDDPNISIN